MLALFTHQLPRRVAYDLANVDGVFSVEPFRSTGVRVSRGAAFRNTTISATEAHGQLRRLVDTDGGVFVPPATGCAVTTWLAGYLGVRPGDTIDVELLERGGELHRIVVAGVFDPMMGQGLYMSRAALARILGEDGAASGAYLRVAPGREQAVIASLKELPNVGVATSRAVMIQTIDEQMRQSMVFVLALIVTSASVIAIGVVYNSARIALSERGRELASLRVLGFTTNEVSGMLLGEQAAALVVALPLGVLFGAGFSAVLAGQFATERFHFPYVIATPSQLVASGVVLAAAAGASVFVRRRVGRPRYGGSITNAGVIMRLKRGHIIGGAALVGVAALGLLITRPKPIVVDAATVNRARLESTIDAEGRTRVRDRYVVVAPVAGRVERITRVAGSAVRAGEIIAVILPLPMDSATLIQARSRLDAADATLIQATAEIRIATAQLDQRSRELGRAERLAEVGGVAPRVVEEARLAHVEAEEAVRVARERARAADADARQARATLAGQESSGAMRTIVRAPAAVVCCVFRSEANASSPPARR